MESCVFSATTFCRHFLWDKKVCHLFHETSSYLFFETSAYKRRPIFEFTNLKRTTRKPQPLFFSTGLLQRVCGCAVHLRRVHSEPIQLLLRPKSTRQDSNKRGCVFPFPFPVWSWFCWYALLIWENRRQDSILATIYKQDRFCVSLSCLVLVLLMCSAHTSSIWQDSSHTYNNLDSIIIARLWLSCAF